MKYFTENHSRKIKSLLWEPVCTWLVLVQAESEADSIPVGTEELLFLFPQCKDPFFSSINPFLLLQMTIFFLRKGYFPVKMPT